jgi:hypothetical protein
MMILCGTYSENPQFMEEDFEQLKQEIVEEAVLKSGLLYRKIKD